MSARVISGKARGKRLKLVPGDTTRPIMDRVKESLFNILGVVSGTRWLDLFAGTGQVGIEALSRGAAAVVFVDSGRAAVQTVRDNLAFTRLDEWSRRWCSPTPSAICARRESRPST
jgi:16S rRNA (guanine966-N2)-methyltransferase